MKLSLIESRLFGRICYGFKRDKYGFVEIVPEQAEIVKTIFRMYREENSLEDIPKYLLSRSIASPSGKVKWSRDVLNKLLNNGKYLATAGCTAIYKGIYRYALHSPSAIPLKRQIPVASGQRLPSIPSPAAFFSTLYSQASINHDDLLREQLFRLLLKGFRYQKILQRQTRNR